MISTHQLCYETHGNSNDPCMMLINGIGGQLIDWPKLFINGLVKHGFYVVTLDNRDSGLSRSYDELGVPDLQALVEAKQQGKEINIPYTLENMAQDVITLMDDLQIKQAHILGGSMGGIITQYVALNFPERVLSLICYATTSGDPALPPPKPEVMAYFSTAMMARAQSFEDKINNKLTLFKIYNHPDYFDENKTKERIISALQRANHPDGFKRLMIAMVTAMPRTELLKQLHCPCLVIHGDYDPAFPLEHGKQLADCIAGSHLEIIDKMGHGIPDGLCHKVIDVILKFIVRLNRKQSKTRGKANVL